MLWVVEVEEKQRYALRTGGYLPLVHQADRWPTAQAAEAWIAVQSFPVGLFARRVVLGSEGNYVRWVERPRRREAIMATRGKHV